MRHTPRRPILLLSFLTLSLSALAPASARKAYPIKPTPSHAPSHAKAHAKCGSVRDAVLELAAQNAINTVYPYFFYTRGLAEAGDAKASSSAAPGHFTGTTGTNNQEQGVDEGDTVKSDGRYIYTIVGNEVVITKSWPTKSLRVVGRYTLPKNVMPRQLQLRGTKLVVLSNIWEQATSDDNVIAKPSHDGRALSIRRPYTVPTFSGTRITILDVRSKTRPRVINETDVEGWLSQSRLIGTQLYLVTNASLRAPKHVADAALARAKRLPKSGIDHQWKTRESLRAKGLIVVRSYLRKKFANASMNGAMPRSRRSFYGRPMSSLTSMYGCSQLTVPGSAGGVVGHGIVNVASINVGRPWAVKSAGAVGNGYKIYASNTAIYAAFSDYREGQRNSTRILKFALRTRWNRGPRFVASGRVAGHLLNQFSMSEERGFLRVMTTDSQWGRGGRATGAGNNLFVLRASGRKLRTVGSIKGLAKGERIFAARMFGDKGYMVTFRQTDPLFTFDLSNPYRPKLAGELKINGFSSYIHPLDGDRLLTIGRDADDDGRVKGLHLQIFDVSNPAKPVRTHHELIEGGRYSYSNAQWDHHAFTFDPKTKTLALPISGYFEPNGGRSHYSGLEVYQVGRSGFSYRGFVSHMNQGDQRNTWNSQITRSMIIGKALITISRVAIQASSVTSPEKTLASVKLTKPAPRVKELPPTRPFFSFAN